MFFECLFFFFSFYFFSFFFFLIFFYFCFFFFFYFLSIVAILMFIFYWPICCLCECAFKLIFFFPPYFFILCAVFISLRVGLGLIFCCSEIKISYFGVVYKFLSVGMELVVIKDLFIILYIEYIYFFD